MRVLVVCLTLFLLVACDREDAKNLKDGAAITAVSDGSVMPDSPLQTPERLLASPPAGWTLAFQFNDDRSKLSDFVPEGETDIAWTQKISFESFTNDINADPLNMLDDEVRRDEQKCEFVQHFNLFSGYENGYPTSVRLFHCGNNHFVDRGEVKMMKTIQGAEQFYIVRILARIEPFAMNKPNFSEEEVVRWTGYLRRISLCDTAAPEHPCPVDDS